MSIVRPRGVKLKKAKHPGLTFLIFGMVAASAYWRDRINWMIVAAAVAGFLILVLLIKRIGLVKSMKAVDAMGGHEFERYLAKVFRGLGYSVETVGLGGGDFGADLIVTKRGVSTAVQAKNYDRKNRVGNDAVQQAIAGATYYNCREAMVVTNSTFTKAAKEQASKCTAFPVTLWSRDDLQKAIKKL